PPPPPPPPRPPPPAGLSVLLLGIAGIVSSALEIYVTLTSVAMAERLACRIAQQNETLHRTKIRTERKPVQPGKDTLITY
ncbi:MAG: hypothetical protein LUK37_20890, partial [Clostridia bacterium]|nr:hypothetical protein [Clostridia bacterium]